MTPVANVSMLIRAPVRDVFDAFLDPDILTRFWLSKASVRLTEGQSAIWEFMVPGAVARTTAKEIVQDRRLVLHWEGDETAIFTFEQREDGFTRIEINSPIAADKPEDAVARAIEATQGYTLVVSNLKTLLESGKSAGLVEDKALLITEKQATDKG